MVPYLKKETTMRKRTLVVTSCLVFLVFLSGTVIGGHRARAAARKTYKSELVDTGHVQAALDQRSAEGWHLVAVSSHKNENDTPVALLIFEKE